MMSLITLRNLTTAMIINSFEKDYFKSLESSWTRIKNSKKPVYIYGMGDGCEKILSQFKRLDIKIDGIFASDDFVRGQSFAGFKIERLSDIEKNCDDFIVVPAFGSSLPEIMDRLDNIAKRHILIMPDTPVAGDEYFSKDEFLKRFDDAKKVFDMLVDEQSKRVFINVLSFKITGDLTYLKQVFTSSDEAYENILNIGKSETYIDLGAFIGDTVMEFLSHTSGQYKKIYALEPDKKNFRKCVKNLISLNNIELFNSAVWSKNEIKYFIGNSGRQGKLDKKGKPIQCRSVDSIINGKECSYIKFDVEGVEAQAILGSELTIKKCSPKICMALYHRAYDLIDLPLMLHKINPKYNFFMRQYSYYPAWETNLFATNQLEIK